MGVEKGEEYKTLEVDPRTGTVERRDPHEDAKKLSTKPEDWREQK